MTNADTFTRNVTISALGHIGVALVIFFRAVTMPSEHIEVRHAIRVDVVGLPKKIEALPEKAPEKPAPAPAVKELPKKAETVAVKPKAHDLSLKKKEADLSREQKDALKKLRQMEALEKIQQEVGKDKSKKPKAAVVAGNKIADGNSLDGLEKLDYDKYFDEVEDKIHAAWSIPQWMADANFKAKVLVLIDERGYVIKKS